MPFVCVLLCAKCLLYIITFNYFTSLEQRADIIPNINSRKQTIKKITKLPNFIRAIVKKLNLKLS